MTRTSWERIDLLHRFLATGIKALVFGLAFWFLLLAISAFDSAIDPERHIHRLWHWPFSFFRSDWGLGLVYGGVFFFAAILASRSRWSCCPALAAFLAYAIFVVIAMPDPMPVEDGYFFLLPLLTAPAGGWLGERINRRLRC